jgi:pimeloyl-ACP methyl ester carboxylesterase
MAAVRSGVHVWSRLLVLALVACGGAKAKPEADRPEPRRDGVFVDKDDFEPTSFAVEVTGSGRPIIFIPGLGCPGEVWDATAEHLEGFESHILTLAGFAGRKPIDKPLSATVRKELTRYIRAKRLDRPVIVGHSMGGFIAFWLATNFPENTGPVIIVDAGPALSGDLEEAKQLREKWAGASDEEFAQQARFMYAGMARNRKALAPIAAKAAQSNRKALGDAIYEMMITDLTSEMSKIESPVLLVLADGYFKTRIQKQVADIPDHEVVILPTGHFIMIDDPKGFYKAIDAFLAAHAE